VGRGGSRQARERAEEDAVPERLAPA
jgi:hypothetical protein